MCNTKMHIQYEFVDSSIKYFSKTLKKHLRLQVKEVLEISWSDINIGTDNLNVTENL